jgi:hypothetical protein
MHCRALSVATVGDSFADSLYNYSRWLRDSTDRGVADVCFALIGANEMWIKNPGQVRHRVRTGFRGATSQPQQFPRTIPDITSPGAGQVLLCYSADGWFAFRPHRLGSPHREQEGRCVRGRVPCPA